MNKVKYGLKNVHYAPITEVAGVITFGTPARMPGAVNLVLNPKGDKTEFYADDMAYFVTTANQGYEGSLEMALIPDTFRKEVLGDKEDKNKALFEDSNAIPKNIALMYEFIGDEKATRHVNYNVSVARPSIESSTKGASIDPVTETINITASPAIDTGYVKAKLHAGDVGYDTFYTSVYQFVPVV
jgi:phi13 family phage major tail protein